VGPEVVRATIELVEACCPRPPRWEYAQAGGRAFERGVVSGVPAETLESLGRTAVALKGPLATPIGHGGKSANVTLRKVFETFANIRPARELPGVPSAFAGRGIDLVIVRENVEDLYAGIEHMQTPSVAQCLKLVSRLGSSRISHAALALAAAEGRSSVSAATKANIMKLTEGLFKEEFEKAAQNYPGIDTRHLLIDNCAHQLVMKPEQFDVIVTTNMNGDILSDLASGLVGGLGFAPSANIGYDVAMFEAVHGTAPDIAGSDSANPTAMVLSAVMMLRHLAEFTAADALEQALFATLEDGLHTCDVPGDAPLGTQAFAAAVGERIGRSSQWPSRSRDEFKMPVITAQESSTDLGSRSKVGLDVFIESDQAPEQIAQRLQQVTAGNSLQLTMISNRGTQVWPAWGSSPTCIDHYRCRFTLESSGLWTDEIVGHLLAQVSSAYRWMHVEKLELHNGQPAFTKAQGQN